MTMTITKDADLRAALEATRPGVCAPALEKGKSISICSGEADRLDYFIYVPKNARPDSPVVAAIHGLRRSAAQQIFQLKAEAERCGMILFAPLFAREQFRHFQHAARHMAPSERVERVLRPHADAHGHRAVPQPDDHPPRARGRD